jgi:uncharacterized membrane protein
MSSLLVFAFTDEGGAQRMIADIQSLKNQQLISVSDAATVVLRPDSKIKIRQAESLVGPGVLGGVFWGMLIGLVFFMPWVGMAVGAVSGTLEGKFSGYGITDSFLKEVGSTVRTCHSALFLIAASMVENKVIEAITRHKATLLRTNLTKENESSLLDAFGITDENPLPSSPGTTR